MKLFCFALIFSVVYVNAEIDPNEFCAANHVTNLFHYADPEDCHFYYQCDYTDDIARGTRMPCAEGLFWNQYLQQCVPEGEMNCSDPCRDEATATKGCYSFVEGGCNTFFKCSNSIGYKFCCPSGTSFDLDSCNCVRNENCTDICTVPSRPATSTLPPPETDGETCLDSYGNYLRGVEDFPNRFVNIGTDIENPTSNVFDCAPGTLFSLATCDCSIFSSGDEEIGESTSTAYLYLPFDGDFEDKSVNHFHVTKVGDVYINSTFDAAGDGAAFFNGGHLEIPSTSNMDWQNHMSTCFFYYK